MVRAQATAKYIRSSAQKAGLVLDLIRGKDINKALTALQFSNKSVARDVAKVLRSAVANVQQKDGFGGDVERLFVSKCHADNGPSMKRVRPAPMGRAFRIVKRTTHLTVEVTEKPQVIKAVGHATRRPGAKRPRGAVSTKGAKSSEGREEDREGEREAPVGPAEAGRVKETVGQKVHPYGFRIGFNKTWKSRWYRRQGLRGAPARGPRAQARPQEALSARGRRRRSRSSAPPTS